METGQRLVVRGLSLIELLIVISIVITIASIAFLLLNPVEYLRKGRDAQRLQDFTLLGNAINLYAYGSAMRSQEPDFDGPNFSDSCKDQPDQKIFASVPSDSGESSPVPPASWTYVRATSTSVSRIDGLGWLPVDFFGMDPNLRPMNILPLDPINTFASGFYYSYTCGSHEINMRFESEKYSAISRSDGGDDEDVYEIGNDLLIAPYQEAYHPAGAPTPPPTPPPPGPSLAQMHYRWRNNDGSENGVASLSLLFATASNPSAGSDEINSVALDKSRNSLFAAGRDNNGVQSWRIERRLLTNGALVFATTSNPSGAGNDTPTNIAVDSAAGFMYVAGWDSAIGNERWRVEKRSLTNGMLTYATTSDYSSGTFERVNGIAIDSTYMYLAGDDSVPGNAQWRIEKRNLLTGALAYTTSVDLSAGDDAVNAIAIDAGGNAMYLVGKQGINTNWAWRIEKRNLSDGRLVYAVVSDPSAFNDEPRSIALDPSSDAMYIAGFGKVADLDAEFRYEKRSLSTGALAYAATNNVSAEHDALYSIVLDVPNGVMYGIGRDNAMGGGDEQWRVEQRSLSNGALLNSTVSNPSGLSDEPHSAAIDLASSTLFLGGYDAVASSPQWRIEKRSLSGGAVATWAAGEDVPISNLPKQNIRRLRFEVSNEGLADATSASAFLLEYSSNLAGPWTAVGSPSSSFSWVSADSAYVVDGASTQNISGGLTDENSVFVVGQAKDTGNLTGGILLRSNEFTELEYSIQATTVALSGQTYYFRVSRGGTSLDSYGAYPSAILF